MKWRKEDDMSHGVYGAKVILLGTCEYIAENGDPPVNRIKIFRDKGDKYRIGIWINKENPNPVIQETENNIKQFFKDYSPSQYNKVLDIDYKCLIQIRVEDNAAKTAKLLAEIFNLTGIDKEHQADICKILGVSMEMVFPKAVIEELTKKLLQGEITVENAIKAALELQDNYPEWLLSMAKKMQDEERYEAMYDLLIAIPKENFYFIEGEKKLIELINFLLDQHDRGAFSLTDEERLSYREALFCAYLNSGEKDLAKRILQMDLMQCSDMGSDTGPLDGTAESYLFLADLYRKQQNELKEMQEENKCLRAQVESSKKGKAPAQVGALVAHSAILQADKGKKPEYHKENDTKPSFKFTHARKHSM